jgi:hypothetical protein
VVEEVTMERDTGTENTVGTDPTADPGPAEARPAVVPELPPPPRRRTHTLRTVILTVVGVLTALTVIGVLAETGRHSPGDTLFTEDFQSGETGFSTDSDRFVDLDVVNGRYEVTIKDATNPQIMRHVFDHTYDGLSFEATVVQPADVGNEVWASVGCWTGESSYVFVTTPDGYAGLLETISESRGERVELTEQMIRVEAARPAGEPNRLRIDCVGGKDGGATIVSGYVNGQAVVSVSIPDGYDSFDAIGFFVAATQDGATISIDDVRVTAGRPQPGMSPIAPFHRAPAEPIVVDPSSACEQVFADAQEALEAGRGTDALDIVGFGAPKECATFAEAEAASTKHSGKDSTKGLEEYLARSCAYMGPSAGIRDTALCREVLARHPELA